LPPARQTGTSIPGVVLAAFVVALAPATAPLHQASADAGPSRSATLAAAADAYVTGSRPQTNFGRARSLRVDANQPARTYLRFRIGALADGAVEARLRIYVTRGSGIGYEVYGSTGQRWKEGSIDYRNAPGPTERLAASGPVGTGWSEVDISGFVGTSGVKTLVLTTSDPGGLRFLSREAASSRTRAPSRPRKSKNAPEIVVTTDPVPDPSASPTPSPSPSTSPPNPLPSPSPTTNPAVDACLARPSRTVVPVNSTLTGTHPADHTFDARQTNNTMYWNVERPADVTTGLRPCWAGGAFIGTQSRSETWETVKDVGGSAVRIRNPGGAQVFGLMVDNHHDGFQFRSTQPTDAGVGDGWTFAHSWMRYIRDDCIENDDLTSGVVRDVLWECFVAFSAARDGIQPNQPGERILFENVLIELTKMPSAQHGMDHGHLLKWSSGAPAPVIRNSIIRIDDNSAGEWPPGTVLENVVLVWDPTTGSAPSLDPMPGLTITTDQSVWETAKADWLARHGCTSFGSCTRLTDPTPT
jgi:hypothetical protein